MANKENWKISTVMFLVSQCITLFGSTLVQMAVVWYATMLTASGFWVSAFYVCSYLPQFLISFIGGVWADRYNRKMLIIAADLSIAAATFVMLIIYPHISSNTVLLSLLLLMSVLRSVGAGIQNPAVTAVIPSMVPESALMKYNGINATMQNIVQCAAPAAAGLIFAISTLRLTLLIDIVTAAIGIGILSLVVVPSATISASENASMIKDLKAGITYSLSEKKIKSLLLLYGIFTFLCVPGGYFGGLLVRRQYGDVYWYLTAVELVGFAGMILGGVLMSTWGGFKSKIVTLAVALFTFGLFAVGMGSVNNLYIYLTLMTLFGISMTASTTTITTLLQENTDASMQGRVFGLMGSMYAGFLPIGTAIFGPLADLMPLQLLVIASGIAFIIISAYIFKGRFVK